MSSTSSRERTINLGAGPCTLPTSVLETAAQGLLDYQNTGMGLVELSHRGKDFQALIASTRADLRTLLGVPDNFEILFMQGGGLQQFSCVVMNLVSRFRLHHRTRPEDTVVVDYLVTGGWSAKAAAEAARLGCQSNIVADSRTSSPSKSFDSIPDSADWKLSAGGPGSKPAFLYYCDNETVNGVEFGEPGFPVSALPESYDDVPLVADMSSNILSRRITSDHWKHLGIVFGGAQKNMGPAGLTVAIVRKDLIVDLDEAIPFGGLRVPATLSYKIIADNQSLYNTPPMFSIYVCSLVFQDLLAKGGVESIEKINAEKAKLVYATIDNSNGFYTTSVKPNARSRMNIVFNCKGDPSVAERFIAAADKMGIKQIKGHRSVGGIRTSLYNAVTLDQVEFLCKFMNNFMGSEG